MAVVKMHQASDGSLHKTKKDCDTHESKLRLQPAVEKFVNELPAEEFGMADGQPVVLLAQLPEFLAKHADTLRVVLNRALVTPKPRKGEGKPRKPRAVKEKPAASTKEPATPGQAEQTQAPTPQSGPGEPAQSDIDDVLTELS